jgi:prepilin-type N-terminal cleavage/methylation domain-containing protein
MKRFNKQIKSAVYSTIERPAGETPVNRSSGFTLIELLVAVGIIAVLIALLLPVIQQRREEYAGARAAANLTMLRAASQEYFARTGQYPDELADLRILSGTPVANGTFNLLVTTGRAEGYIFDVDRFGDADGDGDVDGNDFLLVAEPEHPGITGGTSLTMNLNGLLTSNPTPGANAAREQMFNNIRAQAAQTVVELLRLDANALTQVRSYTEAPATATDIFNRLDSNDDSHLSIAEIRFADTTFDDQALRNPLQRFLNFVALEMKWESLSEEASNAIFVAAGDVNGDDSEQPPLFSYDGLSLLTIIINGRDGNDTLTLLAKLQAAEAAEALGDQRGKSKALKDYQKMVKGLIGQSLTRNQANLLMTLSRTL